MWYIHFWEWDITVLNLYWILVYLSFKLYKFHFIYSNTTALSGKAERWRIDAFELWCWRKFLRVLWTARRSNQSILKEIGPGYSLEDWCWSSNSNTLATWWEELTHLKRPWCWERLKAGEEGDDRGWDGWMASPAQWTWVWMSYGSWWWTGRLGVLQPMGSQEVGQDWVTELHWTGWVKKYLQ